MTRTKSAWALGLDVQPPDMALLVHFLCPVICCSSQLACMTGAPPQRPGAWQVISHEKPCTRRGCSGVATEWPWLWARGISSWTCHHNG